MADFTIRPQVTETFTIRLKTGPRGATGTLEAAGGATGTFTTVDSKTVTVTAGIITSIV